MNELQYVRNKFKDRDQIEISIENQKRVIKWLGGTTQEQLVESCKKSASKKFVKFLNKGVIIINHEVEEYIKFFPFEFTDYDTLIASIYISNPFSDSENTLELLCKVECDASMKFKTSQFNSELGFNHISAETKGDVMRAPRLVPVVKAITEEFPDIKPLSNEWNELVAIGYFNTIITNQLISIIAVNAYLALLDKEVLVTEITQQRIMNASSNKSPKKSKRNPLYRYKVTIPLDYKPRKFDLNYLVSEWEKASYVTTQWVRKENVDVILKRSGGKLAGKERDGKVAIKMNVRPHTCKRRIGNVKDLKNPKSYKAL